MTYSKTEEELDKAISIVKEIMTRACDKDTSLASGPHSKFANGSHSLYTHFTESGDIFYVGICKDSRVNIRPFDYNSRNKIWKRIRAKYGVRTKVLLTGCSEDFIKSLEIWLIAVLGKKTENGILANITDGGDGVRGTRHSIDSRVKMSIAKKGKTGYLCHNSIEVSCEGVRYGSMADAARAIGVSVQTVLNRVRNENIKDYYIV
jgi:hypothetical protein